MKSLTFVLTSLGLLLSLTSFAQVEDGTKLLEPGYYDFMVSFNESNDRTETGVFFSNRFQSLLDKSLGKGVYLTRILSISERFSYDSKGTSFYLNMKLVVEGASYEVQCTAKFSIYRDGANGSHISNCRDKKNALHFSDFFIFSATCDEECQTSGNPVLVKVEQRTYSCQERVFLVGEKCSSYDPNPEELTIVLFQE